ncbi:unnamed protein product [Nezara viridula]|uniref:Uncharacterized protein n=1 Tax=Nezara viridula TaxID=85310 RepID=A0A9P0GYD3_NEZVI|nr:unnamed protein product [Nezara viridula]
MKAYIQLQITHKLFSSSNKIQYLNRNYTFVCLETKDNSYQSDSSNGMMSISFDIILRTLIVSSRDNPLFKYNRFLFYLLFVTASMARVLPQVLIFFLIAAGASANTRKKRNLELLLEPLLLIERLRAEAELRPLLPGSGGLLHGSSSDGHSHQSSVTEVTTQGSSDHGEHHGESNEHQSNSTEHQSNNTEHQSNNTDHQSNGDHGSKEKHKHKMHHHHKHHGGGGH